MAKRPYKAKNIETGEVLTGTVDELAAKLFVTPNTIYRASCTGTNALGVWAIEKMEHGNEVDNEHKWSMSLLAEWDRITRPFKNASRKAGDQDA